MLQYVNSFSCSLSEAKDTLVIHFIQNEPIIPEHGDEIQVEIATHNVASIVMDGDCAKGLISSLTQLFDSPEKSEAENPN